MTGPEQRSLSPDGGTPEPETAALDGATGPGPSERTVPGAAPHAPEAPVAPTGPPPPRSFSPPPGGGGVTAPHPHPQAHLAAPPAVHRTGGSPAHGTPSASAPPPGIPPRSDPLPPPRATGTGAPRTGSLPPRGPQRPAGASVASAPSASARPATSRGRRARLTLRRIDPWSVFLFSVVASIFLGLALLVAAFVLYAVLSSLGVIDSLNTLIGDVTTDPGETAEPSTALTGGRILGVAAVVAAFNVVLLTALATLSAFLYNLCAALTGGIEVTFGDRE